MIVERTGASGPRLSPFGVDDERRFIMARWGMPGLSSAANRSPIRNVKSPPWRRWLGSR
jgi:hypothetical protein